MLEAVPHQVHTILTDNGIQFAEQLRNRNTNISRPMRFDMICEADGIEHRLTKPNHLWTNGQIERMYRTIKDATVKRFHYDNHDQLWLRVYESVSQCQTAEAKVVKLLVVELDAAANPMVKGAGRAMECEQHRNAPLWIAFSGRSGAQVTS